LQVTAPVLLPAVSTKYCGAALNSANVSVLGAATTPLVQTMVSVTLPVPPVGAAPGVTESEADACRV